MTILRRKNSACLAFFSGRFLYKVCNLFGIVGVVSEKIPLVNRRTSFLGGRSSLAHKRRIMGARNSPKASADAAASVRNLLPLYGFLITARSRGESRLQKPRAV
jgi:hypothetical protein